MQQDEVQEILVQVNQSKGDAGDVIEERGEDDGTEESAKYYEADAGDGTKREEQFLLGANLIVCATALFLCMFLVALDQTIVVTILTVVGNKFNAFDKVAWLTSGFLLSTCMFVVFWGRVSIIFGRKNAMIVAIVLFEAGSLMCALANNMNVLIGGRVLAGVGGGGIQSLLFIIITEIVPINRRPLYIGVMGMTFAIASVLGPVIGGSFTSKVSWRWCFYINLPLGGVSFPFFVWAFNPPHTQGTIRDKLGLIDYLGTLLLSSGVALVLVALSLGVEERYGWDSAAVICCFVVGGFTTIGFAVYNFRFSKHPIIPKDIVIVPLIVACAVTILSSFGYFMSDLLYIAIYFQVIHGAGALSSGVQCLPLIIAVIFSSLFGGIFMNKTKHVKPVGLFAAVIGPIGNGLLCLLKTDSNSSAKIGLMILSGISIGLQMQVTMIGCQISAPKSEGGLILSTTFISFSRALGGTVSASLSDAVYSASLTNKLKAATPDAAISKELSKYDLRTLISSTKLLNSLSPEAELFIKEIIMDSIRNVFYMGLGWSILGFMATFVITNEKLPKQGIADNREETVLEEGPESTLRVSHEKGAKLDE